MMTYADSSRDQAAAEDLPGGSTGYVARRASLVLLPAFLILLCVPLCLEFVTGSSSAVPTRVREDIRRFGVSIALHQVERHIVYLSRFPAVVRQPYQNLLVKWLGQGSRQVLVGGASWLFHRRDIEILTASTNMATPPAAEPTIDVVGEATSRLRQTLTGVPRASKVATPSVARNQEDVLANLTKDLRRRGIHLIVLVVPRKSAIYPEYIWQSYPTASGPLTHPDEQAWPHLLRTREVDVLDLHATFWEQRYGSAFLFLPRDTHWSPAGVRLAAELVSDRIRRERPDIRNVETTVAQRDILGPEDLTVMLGLDTDPRQQRLVSIRDVTALAPPDVVSGALAPVLLVGDSLSGYYNARGANSTLRAGLAGQLVAELGVGVQQFVAFGEELPGALERAMADAAVLEHKRIVVLECSIGQLVERRFSRPIPVADVASQ